MLIAVGMPVGGTYPKAHWLQGRAIPTMEDKLCRGPPLRTGLNSVGLSCPLSLTLKCVACEGGWVVLQHGLKLSTGCTGSEVSVTSSVGTHVSPGATWHELQSNLQMAASSAGLGGA